MDKFHGITLVKESLASFRRGEWDKLNWWQRALVAPLALVWLVIGQFRHDDAVTLASSLAFISALSVVPLLSVATSLMAAFGLFESDTGFIYETVATVTPSAAGDIAAYLKDFATNSADAIGGIGGVALVIISLVLTHKIEQTFTNIWRGTHDRPLLAKFLTFYAIITLGPVLLSLSFIHSASLQIYLSRMGIDTGFFSKMLPILYALVLFTLMNKLLPNAKVSWKSALVGGLFTAVAFEVAKWGFNQYINLVILDAYNKIYGALGLIPIFLIWIYITWSIILIGAELAYCYQNLRSMLLMRRRDEHANARGSRHLYDPLVGLEIFAPVATAFHRGEPPVTERNLAARTHYNPTVVRETVKRLLRSNFLRLSQDRKGRGLLPARPLDAIRLDELVAVFLQDHVAQGSAPVDRLWEKFRQNTRLTLDGYTALELVDFDALPPAIDDRASEALEPDELEPDELEPDGSENMAL
jgi:membrane protein